MSLIGKKSNSRATWHINPIVRIKDSRKVYKRNEHKQETKKQLLDHKKF